MSKITRAHTMSYSAPPDLHSHIGAIHNLIAYLRDSVLPLSSKKRMLNHALWEVSHAQGNFMPRFRSKGVVNGVLGMKIERDHVYKRKQLVQDILNANEPLESTLFRVIHCIVTEEEHYRLTRIPEAIDGWKRYEVAGVEFSDHSV